MAILRKGGSSIYDKSGLCRTAAACLCGGHGGGGAGSNGVADAHQTTSENISVSQASLTATDAPQPPGGRGSNGGQGGDGCIIIYYRKLKPLSAGWLRDNTQKPLLDRLGRRLIV